MNELRIDGLDFLGPRKRGVLRGFAEWLAAEYPIGTRIMQVRIQDSSVVRCDVVDAELWWTRRRTGVVGYLELSRPLCIWLAARRSITIILDTFAHEWRHGMQYAGMTALEYGEDNDADEADAEEWAQGAVQAWKEESSA